MSGTYNKFQHEEDRLTQRRKDAEEEQKIKESFGSNLSASVLGARLSFYHAFQ